MCWSFWAKKKTSETITTLTKKSEQKTSPMVSFFQLLTVFGCITVGALLGGLLLGIPGAIGGGTAGYAAGRRITRGWQASFWESQTTPSQSPSQSNQFLESTIAEHRRQYSY